MPGTIAPPGNQYISTRLRLVASLAAAFPLILTLLTSCSSTDTIITPPNEIPGAHYSGNQSCADCHPSYSRTFASSPHGQHFKTNPKTKLNVGCESCHGPGSRHVAAGRADFILNPGKNPATCLSCHLSTDAEFNLPFHHPVPEGWMNCADCHDPHGSAILQPAHSLGLNRLDASCASCHQEQARPFVFEHEAMREGCTSCHSPHGSINRKLLADFDANLCLRCHAQTQDREGRIRIGIGKVDHTDHLKLGTCYTAGCHGAVHGSNVSPKLRY
ncbi:MAG: cytochrome c3 family protein [Limisphaerales bacterium]|jgi:predicted CXXCH cytochrome family protein